jgi:hypothetical protein
MKRALNNHRLGVEKLRWQLIFALSGVGAVMASCSGRSSRTVDDDGTGGASNAGRMGTTGGKGGNGAGGTPTSTGGKGGSGGTNGGAGGTVAMGGSAGFALDGGSFGTPGGAGNVMGGTAGFGGDIAGGGGVSGVGGDGGGSGDGGFGGSCNPGVGGQPGLCDGGFVHRPTAATCMLSERLDGTGQAGAPGAAGTGSAGIHECDTDFDCTDASNGYCTREPSQLTPFDLRCIYACAMDSDCAAGSVCSCDNSYISNVTSTELAIGRCVSATCTTDADCDPGMLCIAPVDSYCGPRRATTFHCQSPNDECAGPDDCTGNMECAYAVDHHECRGKPACGRPFLVDGALRQSELVTGREWHADELARMPVSVNLEARAVIAAHFAEAGLMEHASIAAFARFSLQLLALGAPPELVSACTAAMADETRHARLCFGLASRYAGQSMAPGPLDVTGALAAVTLRDVVELVVHEGCVGETAAALEATWAAEAATDPLVREVLQGIAADEGRHAALAFQFVAWAVEREPALAELVERQLEEAQRSEAAFVASTGETAPEGELEAHGVLSPAIRRAARRAALFDVLPGVVATALGSARRPPGEDQQWQQRRSVLARLA